MSTASASWSGVIGRLIDPWLRRRWQPDPEALARWAHLQPCVVVTGASEGIGLEIARRFVRRGLTVAVVARRGDALAEAAASLNAEKVGRAIALPLDVTRSDASTVIEAEMERQGLYVDILVNNAGMGLGGPFVSHEPDRIAAMLDLNMRALSLLMRHFLPQMCVRGRGGVLNIASMGGLLPGPNQAAYYASKAYVISLTEAVAWEQRGLGVRITAFAPGPVRTRFHAKMGADDAFYRWILFALTPWSAAGSAVRGFAWGRTVVVPGVLGPLMMILYRLTPHAILVPIVSWLLKPRDRATNA